MKKICILSLFLLMTQALIAQKLLLNTALKPFYHGVASGDPLEDRVIIWTRITPDSPQTIKGTYIVAIDTALSQVMKIGTFSTDSEKDYTVKVDVTDLISNTTYYYAFSALGKRSAIGRTKTTPSVKSNNLSDVLKFAIVSCANYEAGYFNAYARVADRNDLNAVIHLGDYYYEYSKGSHRNSKLKDPNRFYVPAHETVTKTDYRLRQSLYHLDKNLQRLHQQHPIIAIWDDHEFANNAYEEGAKKPQPNKGDWKKRTQAAKEAYFEWLPVRGKPDNVIFYRAFSYGKLLDMFLLDTRLEGRQKQPANFDTFDDSIKSRRIISPTQLNWLTNGLKNSNARWKVIGSQVIFSKINVGFSAFFPRWRMNIRIFENLFLDTWGSYLLQRNSVFDAIQNHKVNNVVIVSGDSHNSWAFDLNKQPVLYSFAQPNPSYLPRPNPYNAATGNGYNADTGEGAQGVEFSTPSISSFSMAERLPSQMVARWEASANKPHRKIKGQPNYNPHLKFVDMKKHGYFVLDVRQDSIQTDFFYVPSIITKSDGETWGRGLSSRHESNKITTIKTPKRAPAKDVQDLPAPFSRVIPVINIIEEYAIFMLSPNPVNDFINIQYSLTKKADVDISLTNLDGKLVKTLADIKNQNIGSYALSKMDVSDIHKGDYFINVKTNKSVVKRKIAFK